ncbi:protein kinase [Streptomyces sp. TRM64462]|uniref:protein kinase domain-containing protein n=1 Tax=Streptomyces sp. TRM64462 TaxID=2741726 RepID=UPI001586196E|nr:protein kinase [Streptomyces sp. TRM64462]
MVWEVGDVVAGQYEVTGVHTDGGMGLVYRVRHREWDTDLAVKCPRPELFRTPEQQRLFVREAETWVSIGLHPNVCGCHYVRVLGGIPRVFAEYVPGGSLRDWIRDRRLYAGAPAQVLARIMDLAIQTAWGLQHAHERGLVHQDVKPANVLLDSDGTAKVTDFGIARARAAGGDELVSGGGMTMAYASPEQAVGAPLSRRTDIYSFAVSVFEMFTGEVSWLMGPVVGEALAAFRTEGPRQGPHPEELVELPAAVADLLARCLYEDPARRPESMAAVADELVLMYGELTGHVFPRPRPYAAELRADELNNRALSLLDLGRTTEAGETFEAALKVDPRHPEATYNAGLARWRQAAATDEDLISALEAARADAQDAERVRPLLDEVHRERGAVGPGAVGDVRDVPWYPYRKPDIEIRLTRDGRRALTAFDGMVRLWDLDTGRCLRELDGMRGPVDLGADGRQAVGVGSDGLVRLWDLTDGRCLQTFTPDYRSGDTAVRGLRLLPEPGLVVAGTSDGTVLGWDVTTGRVRYTLEGFHSGPVQATSDGRRLLFHGGEGMVFLCDPDGAREQTVMPVRNLFGSPLCLTADGRTAAAAAPFGGGIHVWDPHTGELLRSFDAPATCLDLSPDGRLLAGASRDGAVRLWDAATGRTLRTFRGHRGEVESVVFLDDGRHLLSAGRDNTARRWLLPEPYTAAIRLSRPRRHAELSSLDGRVAALVEAAEQARLAGRGAVALDLLTQARTVPGHERAPRALAAWRALARDRRVTRTGLRAAWPTRALARFDSEAATLALSPDGRTAAVRLAHTLHVLDAESGERGPVIEGLPDSHGMNVLKGVQFTADGRMVLTANADGSLDAWSVATGTRQAELRLTLGAAAARFTADGQRALVWGADHRVRLWEMASGKCLRTLDGDHGRSPELWLAPDGRTAATCGAGNAVQLWDLDTGRCLRVLRGHTAPAEAICAATERRLLVSCGGPGDARIRLWDTETGACLRVLDEQPGHARAVGLTPDGRFALSRGTDGALRLWELATGRCLRVLDGPKGGFQDALFAPDACSALSAGADGIVRVWELDWELAACDPPSGSPGSTTTETTETTKGAAVFGRKRDQHTAAGAAGAMEPLLQAIVQMTGNPELDTWDARHRRGARSGDTDAMIHLGASLLDQGRTADAAQQFRRAAELGSPMAMHNLSVVLKRMGQEGEAAQWERRAAEQGYARAMVQEGFRAFRGNRMDEAERWLRGAAEQGEAEGMLVLGMMLGERGRTAEAEKWLRAAADKGDPSAMFSLAGLVERAGRQAEAEQWYRRAADKGNPQAMNNLGNILRHSDRAADAERWYRRSAEAGEPMGMLNLGEMLERSRPQEAVQWYRQAAAQGSAKAAAHLRRLQAGGRA